MELHKQNDLHKLRRILDMFEAMQKIKFETEICTTFKNTLNESFSSVIKPEMIEIGNQLKFNLNTK